MNRWISAAMPWICVIAFCSVGTARAAEMPKPDRVLEQMRHVTDWQLQQDYPSLSQRRLTDWVEAAFFAGLAATAETTGDEAYYDVMRQIGEKTNWQLGPRTWHADDHAVGQMYCLIYRRDRKPEMIEATRQRFDELLTRKTDRSLEWRDRIYDEEWAWCDALFMAPPTMAYLASVTGDPQYLDRMAELWWKTTDYLYDPEEHLYYRDGGFLDLRGPTGEKVFWSRGNGWVFGGLVRVLQNMPDDHPQRERFLELYRDMARRLIELQTDDGTWHPDLLAPEHPDVKETSGTGFFVYGLAWGINRGLLDREIYLPHVLRGWEALNEAVHEDGKLGWVQRPGDRAQETDAETTWPYGVGAFLLAGSEVYQIALLEDASHASVEAMSALDQPRFFETVELDWDAVQQRLPEATAENLVVIDDGSGRILQSQTVDVDDDDQPDQLLFQADFLPSETKRFQLSAVKGPRPPQEVSRVFGRYVSERKDDFAWENDRGAFRMYGPALAAENASGGIDAWVKSVRYPVIDKWYAGGDYHVDHGEGMDAYKVGDTAGAGGPAIWAEGKLFVPPVYRSQRRIANGPIRILFELDYEPWETPLGPVGLTLRVGLDRGHNLNRLDATFTSAEGHEALPVAAGLAKHSEEGEIRHESGQAWLSLWEPTGDDKTHTGVGVILPGRPSELAVTPDHALLTTEAEAGKPFRYHAGAGWTGSPDFEDQQDWVQHLEHEAARLASPVHVNWRGK